MDENSLNVLIEELKTCIQPIVNNSVKYSQPTPRKKVFDQNYLVNRLCQPKEICRRRFEHNITLKNHNNDLKTAQHLNCESKSITDQVLLKNNENLKSDNRLLSNKNQRKLLCNNKSNSKDVPKKVNNLHTNDFKTKPDVKLQPRLNPDSRMQNKRKSIYSVREKNNILVHKPNEKCGNKQLHLEKEITEHNLTKESQSELRIKSTKLQPIVKNNKYASQENNSQVKQLTNYWNNLLNSELKEQHDSGNFENQSHNAKKFSLLPNNFTEFQNKNSDMCFGNDNEVKNSYESDIKIYKNPSPLKFTDNYLFDCNKLKLTNNTRSECVLKVHSDIAKDIKVKIFPITPLTCEHISFTRSPEREIFQMATIKLIPKNKITICADKTQRILNENINSHTNKLCLMLTNNNSQKPSEREQQLEMNENSLSIEVINLKKVKKAINLLWLFKEHLFVRFIFNNDLFMEVRKETNNISKHICPVAIEKINTTSICQKDRYNVDEDEFENDDMFWHQNKQILINILTSLKSLCDSMFGQIVLHGPVIEHYLIVAYHFFVSLLIFRIVIIETLKV